MDRPLALLVYLGPPQGTRTHRMDRTDHRNIVEDTVAREATRKEAPETKMKYKHTPINWGITHTTIMALRTRSQKEGERRRMYLNGCTTSPSPLRSPFSPFNSPWLGRRSEQCSNLRRRHPPQKCCRPPVLVAGILKYYVGQLKKYIFQIF